MAGTAGTRSENNARQTGEGAAKGYARTTKTGRCCPGGARRVCEHAPGGADKTWLHTAAAPGTKIDAPAGTDGSADTRNMLCTVISAKSTHACRVAHAIGTMRNASVQRRRLHFEWGMLCRIYAEQAAWLRTLQKNTPAAEARSPRLGATSGVSPVELEECTRRCMQP